MKAFPKSFHVILLTCGPEQPLEFQVNSFCGSRKKAKKLLTWKTLIKKNNPVINRI